MDDNEKRKLAIETREWFKSKLQRYKNYPEFLRGYIILLEKELEYLKNQLDELVKTKKAR